MVNKLIMTTMVSSTGRLESFFGAPTTHHSTLSKRKAEEPKKGKPVKKGKAGGVGKKK